MLSNLRIIIALLLIVCIYPGYAQRTEKTGILYPGTELTGSVFTFRQPIYEWNVEPGSDEFGVILLGIRRDSSWYKDKGQIILRSHTDGRQIWRAKANFKRHIYESLAPGVMRAPYFYGPGSTFTDWKTGKVTMQTDHYPFAYLEECGIFLAYEYSHRPVIIGITPDGCEQWATATGWDFYYEDHIMVGDSTIAIVSDGLYLLNPYTGKKFYRPALTGLTETENLINTLGLAAIAASGQQLYPDSFLHRNSTMSSNVWVYDESLLFWASRESLICVDYRNLSLVWQYPLGYERTGRSEIIADENYIYLVNKGVAAFEDAVLPFGTPYVSVHHIATGKPVNAQVKALSNRILNFTPDIFMNHLIATTPDGLFRTALGNGGEEELFVPYEALDSAMRGNIAFWMRKDVYVHDEVKGFLQPMENIYGHDILPLLASDEKVLLVNTGTFEAVTSFAIEELYLPYYELDNYTFVGNGEKTYILNMNDHPVAEVDFGFDSKVIYPYLYNAKGNSFYKTDLRPVFPFGEAGKDLPEGIPVTEPQNLIY